MDEQEAMNKGYALAIRHFEERLLIQTPEEALEGMKEVLDKLTNQ